MKRSDRVEDVKLELEHTINDTQMSLDTKAMSSNTKTMTYFGEDDDNDEEISLTWDDGTNSNDEDEEIGLTWDDGTDEDEGEISLNQTIPKSSTEVRNCAPQKMKSPQKTQQWKRFHKKRKKTS